MTNLFQVAGVRIIPLCDDYGLLPSVDFQRISRIFAFMKPKNLPKNPFNHHLFGKTI